MATRWLQVCESAIQPAVGIGPATGGPDCAAAGGVWKVIPVDTIINESSPLLNLGQLLAMTPDDALLISAAIAGVWAIAWGFRAIAQSFFLSSKEFDHE